DRLGRGRSEAGRQGEDGGAAEGDRRRADDGVGAARRERVRGRGGLRGHGARRSGAQLAERRRPARRVPDEQVLNPMSVHLLNIAFHAYALGAAGYLVYLMRPSTAVAWTARGLTALGLGVHGTALAMMLGQQGAPVGIA